MLDILWLASYVILISASALPWLSSHGACLCVHIFLFYKDTTHWIRAHPNDLNLIYYLCKTLFLKKKVYILRYWGVSLYEGTQLNS